MKLARLLTLRWLRNRPLRMLLSMFGIVLGVATILAIGITNRTAMLSVTQVFENTSGKANLIVTSADTDARGFDDRVLRRLASFPGILSAVPSVQVQTILAEDMAPEQVGLSFFGTDAGGLSLFGIDSARDQDVRNYTILDGGFLSPDMDAEEMVLVKSYAEDNNLSTGSSVAIVTPQAS